MVINENGDPLEVSNIFSTPIKAIEDTGRGNGVTMTEIHTAEPLVPDAMLFDAKIAFGKLKRYKSPGSVQVPTEVIQAGG